MAAEEFWRGLLFAGQPLYSVLWFVHGYVGRAVLQRHGEQGDLRMQCLALRATGGACCTSTAR
jgi:hypothetical protein